MVLRCRLPLPQVSLACARAQCRLAVHLLRCRRLVNNAQRRNCHHCSVRCSREQLDQEWRDEQGSLGTWRRVLVGSLFDCWRQASRHNEFNDGKMRTGAEQCHVFRAVAATKRAYVLSWNVYSVGSIELLPSDMIASLFKTGNNKFKKILVCLIKYLTEVLRSCTILLQSEPF